MGLNIVVVMPLAHMRGGAERALLDLFRETRADDVRWRAIFLEDGPMVEDARALGIPTLVIDAGRMRHVARTGAAITGIAAQTRKWKGDAILGWMAKAHLYGSPAALLARVPALWFQMGLARTSDRLDRAATRLPAQGILCCSNFAAQAQAQLKPLRPTRVVWNGVDLTRFDPDRLCPPAQARKMLGLHGGGPLIGIVGRMQRWKGMHTLIAALPLLLPAHPGARIVIVGGTHDLEPEYAAQLRAQIASLNLGERVLLAGAQDDIPLWMQAMDVVVHASDREPFGIVALEAMALGKPLVAGSEGGPREIITNGVDGLLAAYDDAPALARAIGRYLDDPIWAQAVGRMARQRALQFSTARYAQGVADAVQSLLHPSV